ncbi:MAG: NAD(P) transhydrogenase subunit alpha [Gemmatimonadetes bacterium]|nr:NAD(P) transhydrogenase subunit alpha [Gemmatimonadota bacterium]
MTALLLLLVVFGATMLVAYALIIRVPPKLHTPLMSLTNAISAVTVLGAVLIFAAPTSLSTRLVGGLALVAVAFNLFGGFVLTHRILRMFRD